MLLAPQSDSYLYFRTPASFSCFSSLLIFPNAPIAKTNAIAPNVKPMTSTLHLRPSVK